jgi:CIC family chloride channel protein
LIFYAVLGVLAGFAAVAFNEGLLHLRAFFKTQRVVPQWAAPGVGGLILGCVGIVALHLTGSSSTFGVGYGQLGIALQMPLPLKMLIVLGIAKLIGTVISYIVRAPVTSIIIIFEMTNNYSIILPLMIANITSYVLASEISPTPIYDALLEQDGIHLPHEQRHALKQLPVSAAMSDTIETLSETETVGEVFARLEQQTNRFHAYPVIDANGSLVGICTFNDLKRALSANESHRSLGATARKNVKTITQRETLDAALVKMGRNGVSQLPVINENESSKPVGMITLEDIARRLACHNEGRQ